MVKRLQQFCDDNSISYATGYRWYTKGQIPGAYKANSGTIFVPDNLQEADTNVLSSFFKTALEFSKRGATIEDFAAHVASRFTLRSKEGQPHYSQNPPSSQDVQEQILKGLPSEDVKRELRDRKEKAQREYSVAKKPAASDDAQTANADNDQTFQKGEEDLGEFHQEVQETLQVLRDGNESDLGFVHREEQDAKQWSKDYLAQLSNLLQTNGENVSPEAQEAIQRVIRQIDEKLVKDIANGADQGDIDMLEAFSQLFSGKY